MTNRTTSHCALIVAHGQPSDPAPAEAELAAFAREVAADLPGWHVASATLAQPGRIAAALAEFGPGASVQVYPMFMADGWFTRVALPERLEAAAPGAEHPVLTPFGLDPALVDVATAAVGAAIAQAGRTAAQAELLLAAHGSFKSPAPAAVATAFGAALGQRTGLASLATGFIDQAPQIAAVGAGMMAGMKAGQGDRFRLCLPFFAAAGGHVEDDLPAALAAAGFDGRVLPPLGRLPGAAGVVAAALRRSGTQAGA